jgi:hypothetical protein
MTQMKRHFQEQSPPLTKENLCADEVDRVYDIAAKAQEVLEREVSVHYVDEELHKHLMRVKGDLEEIMNRTRDVCIKCTKKTPPAPYAVTCEDCES